MRTFISPTFEEAKTAAKLKEIIERDFLGLTEIYVSSDWRDRKLIRDSWEHTRLKASEFGLILLEYYKKGCVIIFEYKDKVWQPLRVFGQTGFGQKRLACGPVESFM